MITANILGYGLSECVLCGENVSAEFQVGAIHIEAMFWKPDSDY
jgi:hypothetical protein